MSSIHWRQPGTLEARNTYENQEAIVNRKKKQLIETDSQVSDYWNNSTLAKMCLLFSKRQIRLEISAENDI